MAKLTGSIKIDVDFRDPKYRAKQEAQIATVIEQIKARNPGDKLSGEIIRFQVADGYAEYMIESSKPLRIAHLNIDDGYAALAPTIRGLTLADVTAMVEADRRWAKLAGGKS